MATRIGVYPGTFDPITLGHEDIISRAAKVVDHLIVGVAVNAGKGPLFSLDERVAMVEGEIAELDINATRIEVRPMKGLLMHFVEECGGSLIVRGLRAVSDFEYEFQMVGMNARLNDEIETVFLMASENHQFISSRLVKEIGMLGGDIEPFLSPRVVDQMSAKLAELPAAE